MLNLIACVKIPPTSDRCLTDSMIVLNDKEITILTENKEDMSSLIGQLHGHNESYKSMCSDSSEED